MLKTTPTMQPLQINKHPVTLEESICCHKSVFSIQITKWKFKCQTLPWICSGSLVFICPPSIFYWLNLKGIYYFLINLKQKSLQHCQRLQSKYSCQFLTYRWQDTFQAFSLNIATGIFKNSNRNVVTDLKTARVRMFQIWLVCLI